MTESKLLDIHQDKSVSIVLGSKRARKKLLDELSLNPLQLCGHDMATKDSVKYLGDQLCVNQSESVFRTIKGRLGVASQAIYEIRSVVDDRRTDAIGRITVAFDLWEMAIVPCLLHNAETWTNITSKSLKLLDKIQAKYLRLVLAVGQGCPIVTMYTETATLLMSNRILLKKLIFMFHISNLPIGTLARDFYERQRSYNLGGLYFECIKWTRELGLGNPKSYTTAKWKSTVRQTVHEKNTSDLIKI